MSLAPQVTDWPQKIDARYYCDRAAGPEAIIITEARVVAELARKVHEYGGQFAAWPRVRHETMGDFPSDLLIVAEGWAIPR